MSPSVVANLPDAAIQIDRNLALLQRCFGLVLHGPSPLLRSDDVMRDWWHRDAARRILGPIRTARWLNQRPQAAQVRFGSFAAIVDREGDSAVAEALERLPQAAYAALALPPNTIEIDLDRHELGPGTGFVDHVARGADDNRSPGPAVAEAIDVEEIALVDRRACACDRELDVAIDRIGEGWVQDDLRAQGSELARGLRKPHVIADG